MGGVETPPRLAAEDVALEKNTGPPVRQETAPGRLDDHYRPQHGRIDTGTRCRDG
jgi:hypothetical protein